MTDAAPVSAAKTFSLVIPAWNESAFIGDAVNAAQTAIAQQQYAGSVIVVDNNSTDDTADIARAAGARVVFEPINQIARARNAGANASESDWLVFVDADTLVTPELLTLALDALATDDVVGGGSTIAADRPTGRVGSAIVWFWNGVSVTCRTAAGCFFYCRHDAFDDVGGFNNRVYAAEEVHLSWRLRGHARRHGQRFVVQTAAPIVTSARKFDWYSVPQLLFQVCLLIIPFATHSKRLCGVWYDRSRIRKS